MSKLKETKSQESGLSPSKLSLFEKWRRGKYTGESIAIPRREASSPAALSFGQERLWFLNKLEPDSPAYNECFAIRLEGQLNVTALKESLDEILLRHESLRTSFAVIDEKPAQIINTGVVSDLTLIDLCEWPEERRKAEAEALINQQSRIPFDF